MDKGNEKIQDVTDEVKAIDVNLKYNSPEDKPILFNKISSSTAESNQDKKFDPLICKENGDDEGDGDSSEPGKIAGTGRWTEKEHKLFIEALEKYGKDWKKVKEYVGTRTTTQARSHAQKYFSKVERRQRPKLKEKEPDSIPKKIITPEATVHKLTPEEELSLQTQISHIAEANLVLDLKKTVSKNNCNRGKRLKHWDHSTNLEMPSVRKQAKIDLLKDFEQKEDLLEVNKDTKNCKIDEEFDDISKISRNQPLISSFGRFKNEIYAFQQDQSSEPNFDNFAMEYVRPLDLNERKNSLDIKNSEKNQEPIFGEDDKENDKN